MPHRHHILFVLRFSTMMIFAAIVASVSVVKAEDTPTATPAAPAPAVAAAAPAAQPATTDAAVQPAAAVAPAPVAPAATTAVAQPAAAAVQYVPAGDPYGFTSWLNGVRAQYGLRAVGYDPNLTNWASVNNQHQASRGMGHFVMGPARRQNCAMGHYAVIGAMWMASPAHQAALLDPTISYIGIAGYGTYWTFNAY